MLNFKTATVNGPFSASRNDTENLHSEWDGLTSALGTLAMAGRVFFTPITNATLLRWASILLTWVALIKISNTYISLVTFVNE